MKLLVVDFDFFFPNLNGSGKKGWELYDWAHREAPFFIDGPVWNMRATAFMMRGMELPGLSGEQRQFWSRFKFDPDAALYIADSNSMAASNELFDGVDRFSEVWLYDAHHDCGYPPQGRAELLGTSEQRMKCITDTLAESTYSCENWMLLHWGLGSKLHVRYPSWMSDWAEPEEDDMILPIEFVDRRVDSPENRPDVVFDRVFVCRSGAWVPPWCDRGFLKFIKNAPRSMPLHWLDDKSQEPRAFSVEECQQMIAAWKLTSALAADLASIRAAEGRDG